VGARCGQAKSRELRIEGARRRQIDVVLMWRLDRWVRLVTDPLARLQAHYTIRSYHGSRPPSLYTCAHFLSHIIDVVAVIRRYASFVRQ
jgi:hypothetical protein